MNKVRSVERLIRPKSIAVLGGSWAHSVIEQCQKMGYEGELWPVHPKHDTIAGLRCYASINELPSPPDATFLGVNREATIELVAELSRFGAGGAVCFAAGFSEAVEEDAYAVELQHALIDAAGNMPILGPNCYGFINCLDRALLWPDQHGAQAVSSGVAIVTQSSNIAINLTMQTRALPIAYVFTAGNQAALSLATLALTALEDERVTAVGLHIEGFGSIRDFETLAARAKDLGKTIVALKVGKSEAAQQALKSHTSSLAGSDASANAFLNRLGFTRAHSVAVFLELLKLFHVGGVLPNNQVLSMSCSGGEACLMGDAIVEQGLSSPELNTEQQQGLRQTLGTRVALANPLDYHTYIWNDFNAMRSMFAAMLKSKAAIAVLVLDFPRLDRCEYDSWLVAIDAYKSAGEEWDGQLAVLASLPENMPESIAQQLLTDGIVPFCGLDDAMVAIAAASNQVSSGVYEPVLLPSLLTEKAAQPSSQVVAIEEAAAKRWLSEHHIRTPKGVVLGYDELFTGTAKSLALSSLNVDYLSNQCRKLKWPVVLKKSGSLHKSDSGGVVLNIANQQQLQQEIVAMSSISNSQCDKLANQIDFLLEEQIEPALVELLIGVVRDPVHGYLLTLGAGGIQTEILSDTASALLPLTRDELLNLLSQLRCFPLLTGYRGKKACNLDALLDTLMQLQHAATSIADDLYELEVNPLLCGEHETIAVDALIRVNETSHLFQK